MRAAVSRFRRLTGAGIALAAGAMIVLGTTPASADSTTVSVLSNYHGRTAPSRDQLESSTRSQADQKCVAAYGYRARGVTYDGFHGGGSASTGYNWWADWRCDSN